MDIIAETEKKGGLTWRSIVAVVFAAVVLQPAVVYLYLVAGALVAGAAQYVCIFTFAALTRLFSEKPLSKQESFIIWALTPIGAGTGGLMWVNLIYKSWYRTSYVADLFGLAPFVPDWYSPPPSAQVLLHRTFLAPSFVTPILITIAESILVWITDISLGYLTYYMYSRVEKLPFPLATVAGDAINTLTERKEEKMRIFVSTTMVSMAYSAFVYCLPVISGTVWGSWIQPIPMLWYDFNSYIEMVFPGASLGIATSPITVAIGLLLPPNVVLGAVIGSFLSQFVGNWLLVRYNIFTEWTPGMNIELVYQRTRLYFWISPIIGLSIAVGFLPLVRHPDILKNTFRSLAKLSKTRGEETIPVWAILGLFLGAAAASVILVYILVPGFPIWILVLLYFGGSLLQSFVSARAMGTAGFPINLPFVANAAYLLSGYKETQIWFAPDLFTRVIGGSANWAQDFRVAEICEAKIVDYIKGWVVAVALSIVISFLFVQLFWAVDTIPSNSYPYTVFWWPTQAINRSLWIATGTGISIPGAATLRIDSLTLLSGFVVGAVYFAISEFIALPFSLVGILLGVSQAIPSSIALFLGLIIGKALERRVGEENWSSDRPTIVAGILTGNGLMVVVGSTIALIAMSIWSMPY